MELIIRDDTPSGQTPRVHYQHTFREMDPKAPGHGDSSKARCPLLLATHISTILRGTAISHHRIPLPPRFSTLVIGTTFTKGSSWKHGCLLALCSHPQAPRANNSTAERQLTSKLPGAHLRLPGYSHSHSSPHKMFPHLENMSQILGKAHTHCTQNCSSHWLTLI